MWLERVHRKKQHDRAGVLFSSICAIEGERLINSILILFSSTVLMCITPAPNVHRGDSLGSKKVKKTITKSCFTSAFSYNPEKGTGGLLSVKFICINGDLWAQRGSGGRRTRRGWNSIARQTLCEVKEEKYLVSLLVDFHSNCKYCYDSHTNDADQYININTVGGVTKDGLTRLRAVLVSWNNCSSWFSVLAWWYVFISTLGIWSWAELLASVIFG